MWLNAHQIFNTPPEGTVLAAISLATPTRATRVLPRADEYLSASVFPTADTGRYALTIRNGLNAYTTRDLPQYGSSRDYKAAPTMLNGRYSRSCQLRQNLQALVKTTTMCTHTQERTFVSVIFKDVSGLNPTSQKK
ncbi:hypothetical protein LSAT2_011190 [Lamellibrachia satsuma]|nr:hypothetical protein LSAT2_011190 [Lamellibrachia satsuma]